MTDAEPIDELADAAHPRPDVRWPDLRPGDEPGPVEGAIDEIPPDGPVILAANHASNLDAIVIGAWLIPRLGRRIHWLGKKELFDWPIVGWTAANGGVHPVDRGAADLEAFRLAQRILDEGNILFVFPEGTRSPDGALQGRTDGVAALATADRRPDRPARHLRLERRLAEGPEAAPPGRSRDDPHRSPVPARRAAPAGHGPADREGPRHDHDHGADRGPPAAAQRGATAVLGAARDRPMSARPRADRRWGSDEGPRAIIGPWEPSRKSASRSAPASATAFARRSTRRRRRRPPARRRIPSARSSTTRASSATSRTSASRRSRSLDDVDHGAAVVIRAHGVRPDVMERAEQRGLEVIDGTCTWVIQEQRELAKLVEEGYTIVLLGTPKHPEVVGLLGFAPDAIVVDEEEEWEAAIPRTQADGAHLAVHPAALEVREAGRVHGLARPRAQDRQHRLPGHDPAPAGHPRGGRRGRPDGRRRGPVERQHQGADPAVRDRRDGGDPDRERPRPDDPAPFAKATHRRRHGRHVDPDRGPARRGRAHPRDGRHARGAAPTPPSWPTPRSTAPRRRPAGRPRSRPPRAVPTRSAPPAPPDTWRADEAGSRSSRSSADRMSARARCSTGSSASARRSSRIAPGPPATACTATPSGTAGGSSSSTPAGSSSTRTIRSRRASRSRRISPSPRRTSSCSSSTR